MIQGLSTNRHCHPFADCLVRQGMEFVIRYYSRTTKNPQKRLTHAEAAQVAKAGLRIATVYQDRGRLLTDFDHGRGVQDGMSAQQAAESIAQPPGSAIYFAVDADFASQEIQDFVIPYFRGVKEGMDRAAGGASAFDIGVYGSGLSCQLVRENFALAKYTWLSGSAGWRNSSSYATWDLRQSRSTGKLCGLAEDWELCEGRGHFGEFKPVGFEAAPAVREMWVTAARLNLRPGPAPGESPPITQLLEGQSVRVLSDAAQGWAHVHAVVNGADVIGFVNTRYLSEHQPPLQDTDAPRFPLAAVPPVHYRENDPQSRRGSTARRAQPLGESGRPSRNPADPAALRVGALGAIMDWLQVDKSPRYRPADGATYCNVYAADFCYLAGAYLPRVWWTPSALMQIATGTVPPVSYGTTVREMRADDLYAWLAEFGPAFGWERVFEVAALQDAANRGAVGVIVADRLQPGRPGHISVVVPETADYRAQRDDEGMVVLPLQSQAGAKNLRCGTLDMPWWKDPRYADEDGFFVHP